VVEVMLASTTAKVVRVPFIVASVYTALVSCCRKESSTLEGQLR
jgi:hypothetical protein